jgi:hypothetical protein
MPHKPLRLFTAFALLCALAVNARAQERQVTKEFRLFVNFNSVPNGGALRRVHADPPRAGPGWR